MGQHLRSDRANHQRGQCAVAVDSGGTSAHITGPAEWQKRIATGEFKGISVNAG